MIVNMITILNVLRGDVIGLQVNVDLFHCCKVQLILKQMIDYY